MSMYIWTVPAIVGRNHHSITDTGSTKTVSQLMEEAVG